ncbi:hypothetical protein AYL99_08543 [Fonsecaea erecta]|uniref:Uncharacterized protein n=1 Tax=Fonsecaea erecta TaxID=1367422 RepID=A0A178ZFG7_9EURO|nr:hypothetical protein AYL99_08543 [Fonsecaea erecta]OAP57805.1 hypothetical protein AYL99_08543 [Fonsecaea erecta]
MKAILTATDATVANTQLACGARPNSNNNHPVRDMSLMQHPDSLGLHSPATRKTVILRRRWEEAQERRRLRARLKHRMRELRRVRRARELQRQKADLVAAMRRRIQMSVDKIVHGHSDAERERIRKTYLVKRAEAKKEAKGHRYGADYSVSESGGGDDHAIWGFGLPDPNGEREVNTLDLLD